MNYNNVKYILTDIEGTTTSISFVFEVLFPYFRNNIQRLEALKDTEAVKEVFEQTKDLVKQEGKEVETFQDFITVLQEWSLADKKVTPLKTVQGLIWKIAYEKGEVKGHVYPDVLPCFEAWKNAGLNIGIFSSGSVEAQILLFKYSTSGDLTKYLSDYFDTKTGMKRDPETYRIIAEKLKVNPSEILFLSDIKEELEAADVNGYQTCQLIRENSKASWKYAVKDFKELEINQ
ncbi:MAG: acireductone synthase [Flavobacteriia bacterium]|nr:acireductone synthase [Flavobacteriia bacterium]OJX37329.1 MAG: 2,3-diketo-5-methylthio-1-phosphopentane phosphatase [Flavobacteriia bacterium 40-80]